MELTPANAVEYLRARGELAPGEGAHARELSGGVSNAVILVSKFDGDELVLKQARGQLKVADPWFCSVDRIWREVDVLRQCERLLQGNQTKGPCQVEVPRLLFEDRENHAYGMSAAPARHVVWKSELLSGVARAEVARACGTLLGTLHAKSWHSEPVARELDDRKFFDELRLDPYYRQVARVDASVAPAMERLIESVWSERHCLVHGDFSPKNLLVYDDRVMLIDFEVGHYGDPAFDLGFFLTHLMLKAYYHAPNEKPNFDLVDLFWDGYQAELNEVVSENDFEELIGRGILNFAGCALARLDGKSKIDYLRDSARRDAMRELCRTIFSSRPKQWKEVRELAEGLLKSCVRSA